MERFVKVYSWIVLALFLAAILRLYGMNPNLIGPSNIVPLLPFGAAIFVYYFGVGRWSVWFAILANALFVLLGVTITLLVLSTGATLGGTITGLLFALLPVPNLVALWSRMSKRTRTGATEIRSVIETGNAD